MEIEQNIWGITPEGEAVIIYTMRNSKGATVKVSNIGAALVSVIVPDRNGVMEDVTLGYGRFEHYVNDSSMMGKTVGRYTGRIANGEFILDNVRYNLQRNSPPNHIHGGMGGFANRVWQSRVEVNRVVFSYLSPAEEEGYPGEVGAEVVYDWDEDSQLEITFYAKTSSPTVLNLSNHAYFNLAGENAGSVLGHTLQLNASKFLELNRTQIPTGEALDVEGSPMDFRSGETIGKRIDENDEQLRLGFGYDHYWIADNWEKGVARRIAELHDPKSGRLMTVYTSHRGAQISTANLLKGCPEGKLGKTYNDRDGVAIVCAGYPDAPNHAQFPSQRLDPEETYTESVLYKFGVR